ncbi:MAG: hypothetical protein AAFP98_08715 [Pseudomonadota bacterium]
MQPSRQTTLLFCLALSACGGTAERGVIADPPPVTFNTSAIAITEDRLANTLTYARNQDTAITGSATFSGGFLADLEVNGTVGQSLVGNIDMAMDFETDEVTGQMRNMGIANADGVATEGVLGTIALTGTVGPVAAAEKPEGVPNSGSPADQIAQNILDASGSGTLTGNFGQDRQGDVDVDVIMLAHARTRDFSQRISDDPVNLGTPKDWFSGPIRGTGDGVHDIFFDGRFYLFED